jgi:hypothetical protein
MKHSAITLKSPGACRAYLSTKVLVCTQAQVHSEASEPTHPIGGILALPSPAATSDQSGRPAPISLI